MLIKNTSNKNFNLESGLLEPGWTAEANAAESKLLLTQGLAEVFDTMPVINGSSNTTDETIEPEKGALELLKVEAESLGLNYHPMIKAAALQRKIDERLSQ